MNVPDSACRLPPVRVSADREIRTVVGLRPFRPSGFRVAKEMVGEKTVVHNYGHGGGGITLSWGTSKLAIDLGLPGHVGPVAVLGCGAVGLATARLGAGGRVRCDDLCEGAAAGDDEQYCRWAVVSGERVRPGQAADAGVYGAVCRGGAVWVSAVSDHDQPTIRDSLDAELLHR